jgi:glycerol dehydrogenase-like iron-containing ADH family enzyme
LTEEDVVEGLVGAEAIRPDRYTILSKVKLDEARARALAEETDVI